MNIDNDILYIGVNDTAIRLFESQYPVSRGMSYNSYLIIDERIAVLDTVDRGFGEEWLEKLESALDDKSPDYLVVHHMEPDHSANIAVFLEKYPKATVVSSAKAFAMMKSFFGTDYAHRRIVVGEGDSLPLGKHTLSFITAPMVHWPEVILSFDKVSGTLFSADAFGKFGTIPDPEGEEWAEEARRYYMGIVGKYGAQALALLNKASPLAIKRICPLHGPVLSENLEYYLGLYNTWASYEPEEQGVTVACASVYGNTMRAARELCDRLSESGVKAELYDLCRCDQSYAVAAAFKNSALVLASSTYNADVFPPMREFIHKLNERGFKKRTVALIENGSWAPTAAKVMANMLESAKELRFTETRVRINSAPNAETSAQLAQMAKELSKAQKS